MSITPATSVRFADGLLSRLPQVRGRLTANAPLAHLTWLNVGGPAEVLFRPLDQEDLAAFLAATPADIPVTLLGVASNVIIRDGGIPGVVVRLGRDFADIAVDTAHSRITAGAAALDMNVAMAAAQHGIAGLEFLSGIPGSIGGGLRMNAGAYDREFKDVLVSATTLTRAGRITSLTLAEMQMSYRRTAGVSEQDFFVGCTLQGTAGDSAEIEARMMDIKEARAKTQPIRTKTGGSTFANPEGHKAWELIDSVGGRGLKIGGAEMSTLHCNFMLNTGGATAADLERLGEELRRRVREAHGVDLRWEVRRIGVALPEDTDIISFAKQQKEQRHDG